VTTQGELMKPLYKCYIFLILLSLTACSPAAADIVKQAEETTVPTSTPAPTCTPTPAVLTLDQKVDAYLKGEIDDVGDLSSQELAEFSSKLSEKKNAKRGINPIIYNNEKYIDPEDLKVKDYDGHPDMNETIQMFVPIAGKDEQGNLQFESNGELVTIPCSANVDWNMQITDPYDTRINWPKTKPREDSGLPEAQDTVDYFGIVLNPMIFLDKQVGELKLNNPWGPNDTLSTLAFYDIVTDTVGNPVLAKMILTIGTNYSLFEEGGTLDTQSFMGQIPENSYVYQGLQANAVYYVGISPKQTESYEKKNISFDVYQGIIAGDKSFEMIMEQEKNNEDIVLVRVSLLIRKTTNTAK